MTRPREPGAIAQTRSEASILAPLRDDDVRRSFEKRYQRIMRTLPMEPPV
eukprot:CAMPEP_0170648596 /NCGR_PEP_ID=MMETSP0224-20130122/44818_1 /TAXON_ID=285029 /ORGANISM="Togula jolla, Strain CCCM 725" /LENGTH=49 /DNA_ID= /DNA_START= /DNA_END= /DNA_ORIENTATION=